MSGNALIIVDVQNDFLPPDGALAVPEGRQIIPVIQELLEDTDKWDIIVASQVILHPEMEFSWTGLSSARAYLVRYDTFGRTTHRAENHRRKRDNV